MKAVVLKCKILFLCYVSIRFFAFPGAQAKEVASIKPETSAHELHVELGNEEFTDFRKLSQALLQQSKVYWREMLLADFAKLSSEERSRLSSLKSESNEMKRAYEAGFDRVLKSIERDQDSLAAPGAIKSLKVFGAGLQAFRAMNSNQEDAYRKAIKLLEPLAEDMLDSRIKEEHAVFSLSVLAIAYLHLDLETNATKVVGAFVDRRQAQGKETDGLLLTLYGDALFRSFRYRESFERYSQAARGIGLEAQLAKHLHLRLLWAAYRSGFYEDALAALENICVDDIDFWKKAERQFLEEIARIGATVFYRIGRLDRVQSFAAQEKFGECRSKVSLSYVEKHARNGQFLLALSAYDTLLPEMVFSAEFLDASRIAKEVAERDREGIDKNKAREIVRFAVPVVVKGGEWARMYAREAESALQKKREKFVKDFALAAADSYYEEALLGAKAESFVTSAMLFSARLQEGDVFIEKPEVTFKLGYSLYRSGQIDRARNEIGEALKTGNLKSDYRMAGRETLAAIASLRYQQQPSESSLTAWSNEVTELMSEFPSLRSMQVAMNYFETAESQVPELALDQLHEVILMLAPTPSRFSELKSDCIELLIRLVLSQNDKKLALQKFAQFERIFRGGIGAREFAQVEQANHTLAMTYYAKLRSEGRLNDSLETLEMWTRSNPDNAFLPEALVELLERRYERNQWKMVVDLSNEFLSVAKQGTRLEPGSVMINSPAALRIKFIRGLALESLFQFSDALKIFIELATVDSGLSKASSIPVSPLYETNNASSSARKAIIERYLNWLEPAQRKQVLELSARESPSEVRTLLFGLREAARENDERRMESWIQRIEKFVPGDSTAEQRLVKGIARFARGAAGPKLKRSPTPSLRNDAVAEVISKNSFLESAADFQIAAREVVSQLLVNETRRAVSQEDYLAVTLRAMSVPIGALSLGFGNALCESVSGLNRGFSGTGARAQSGGVDGFLQLQRLQQNSARLALGILKYSKSTAHCLRCETAGRTSSEPTSVARAEFEFVRLARNLFNTLGYKVKPEDFSELLGVGVPVFEQALSAEISKAVFKDSVYELEE